MGERPPARRADELDAGACSTATGHDNGPVQGDEAMEGSDGTGQRSAYAAGNEHERQSRLDALSSGLRVRSFRWWFFSQILSASGTMTQAVAQSWLLLRLTNDALLLSLLTSAIFAPSLLGGAWAGSIIDRYDRRKILLLTQGTYILLSTALGVLVATGTITVWSIFVFAFATGCVTALDSPARQIFVLDLVGTDKAANAVSMNEVVLNASRVLGPALGGALLATVGVAVCFFYNAGTFLPPIVVVLTLLHRRGWASTQAQTPVRNKGHVREGIAYVATQPALRSCVLMAIAGGMLFNMGSTMPLLATRAFHAGAGAYGALMACFGVGALFGALLAGSGPAWPSGRKVRYLGLSTGVEVLLAALSPSIWVLFAGMVMAGFLSIWFVALANTLVQLRTEPRLRGRVMGVWTMGLPGMNPVTSPLMGEIASWGGGGTGAREAFGSAGAALVLSALVGWRALADRGRPATGR
ncbi:MAG TPA: MFS transporter [Acidimicrobiales bacterium]|nr:MFS transporter [Acidimicrobiales bacterium]